MKSSVIEKDLSPDIFIGISLPLNHTSEGFFKKTKTTLDQTRYNIRNLLLTIKGERLGNPSFGSDLYRILFEPNDGSIAEKIEEAIRSSMSEYLSYVNIESINVSTSDEFTNAVDVKLKFTLDVDQRVAQMDINLRKDDLNAGDGYEVSDLLTGETVDTFEVGPFYDY